MLSFCSKSLSFFDNFLSLGHVGCRSIFVFGHFLLGICISIIIILVSITRARGAYFGNLLADNSGSFRHWLP